MLLVVDIGNSNVKLGVFDTLADPTTSPLNDWRVVTDPASTVADYKNILATLLSEVELTPAQVKGVVIGSVVPSMMKLLAGVCRDYLSCEPFIPTSAATSGLEVDYDPPGSLGIDRLADAVAAEALVGAPCIAVDMGTATTFNVVLPSVSGGKPRFAGGAISPGAGVLSQALSARTAQLPPVRFEPPAHVVAGNSVEALQSGLFYGYAALIDGMVERLRAEIASPDCPVVATGGNARGAVPAACRTITRVEPFLTLSGLGLIYERNR